MLGRWLLSFTFAEDNPTLGEECTDGSLEWWVVATEGEHSSSVRIVRSASGLTGIYEFRGFTVEHEDAWIRLEHDRRVMRGSEESFTGIAERLVIDRAGPAPYPLTLEHHTQGCRFTFAGEAWPP